MKYYKEVKTRKGEVDERIDVTLTKFMEAKLLACEARCFLGGW